jgi:hypothetical protein
MIDRDVTCVGEMITSSHQLQPLSSPPVTVCRRSSCKFLNTIGGFQRVPHNHPSGDPTPSQADIQMTKAIVDIAKPLGIAVHDHIIVGKNGHTSFKGMRLI